MAQKRRQYLKTQTGLEKQLFESSADIVELAPITGMTSTNVQDAIAELQNIAAQGGVTSVNGKTGAVTLTKADVGLGNVDNTSDANKPISTATQTALDKKANTADLGTLAFKNSLTKSDVGLGNVDNTSDLNKPISTATQTALNAKANTADLGALAFKDSLSKTDVGLGNVTNDAQVKRSEMGAANGVATLDAQGKVPSAQLPSYVDDVLEYNNLAAFPKTGEGGKIYIDTTTNKEYRWGGTEYREISASLALGETSSTAYPGDKGKANADAIAAGMETVGNLSNQLESVSGTATSALNKANAASESIAGLETAVSSVTETANAASSKADANEAAISNMQTDVNAAKNKADENETTINQIVDGTTKVGSATHADGATEANHALYADNATNAQNASTAGKLSTPRTISLTGDATGSAQFDGSANAAIAVSLKNSGVVAGTYSVVQVDAKGVVTAGNQLVEWGVSGQTEPSANLAIGGIFFELIE